MTRTGMFRLQEQTAEASDALAAWAAALEYDILPDPVRRRLPVMLTDLLGVTLAGMRTPELDRLVNAWDCPPGDAPLLGTSVRTVPDTAAYLAAVAACSLELDEGNKQAAGHPAAHVVFAAMAAARTSDETITGRRFLTAVAAGYEVAARFGHATIRDPAWHPHGNWAATGAACASALLHGCSAAATAAAIDASTGLMHVTPWATVLAGDFTRNLWIAGANLAGLHAARLARAGVAGNHGAAANSLGALMGDLDPDALVGGLGERWLVAEGYLKMHSSCSYTHPAVDIVQSLRASRSWQVEEISRVVVRTNSLARPLLRRHPDTRLAAMFSLPFVVSTAVVSGSVDSRTMEPGSPQFLTAEAFSERVQVEVDETLDALLPDRRCTEVTIEFADGQFLSLGQPNPLGDADHFPLTDEQVMTKLSGLLGSADAARVGDVVGSLAGAPDAVAALDQLV
ncbi:MAG: 2-methylcitrate dehydratase [Propionibacteriales bacterium]|nr:2-methylcitrate dehydratase [Propionibacteriales bacterium]